MPANVLNAKDDARGAPAIWRLTHVKVEGGVPISVCKLGGLYATGQKVGLRCRLRSALRGVPKGVEIGPTIGPAGRVEPPGGKRVGCLRRTQAALLCRLGKVAAEGVGCAWIRVGAARVRNVDEAAESCRGHGESHLLSGGVLVARGSARVGVSGLFTSRVVRRLWPQVWLRQPTRETQRAGWFKAHVERAWQLRQPKTRK